MRIILLFLFSLEWVIGSAQVSLSGEIESVPEGSFLILRADTRDTLATGRIRNAMFATDILLPNGAYAVPAMIMMVSEDRTMSQAAPLALSTGRIILSVDRQGIVHYAGSVLQDDFNNFLDGARDLVMELEGVQDSLVRDSISNLLGERFDEYYERYRNTGLAWFNALWIADLIDRKWIDPNGLRLLKGRCGTSHGDGFDSIACAAILRFQEDWSGKVMPSFVGRTVTGEEVKIGRTDISAPTVIDFWASWCGPCLREFPGMKQLFAETGVRIITISIDSRRQDWESSLSRLDLPWLNLWDADGSAARTFQVTAVPAKFVIDRDGRIVSRNPADLGAVLRSLSDR